MSSSVLKIIGSSWQLKLISPIARNMPSMNFLVFIGITFKLLSYATRISGTEIQRAAIVRLG
jgi:hypothetical protein